MKTLGASIAIWRGVAHDFCFEECIRSVAPICEHIVVAEIRDNDGTHERLLALEKEFPQLAIVDYTKPASHGDSLWVMDWTNFARERLSTDYNLQIDADEILSPTAYEKILERIQDKEVTLRCRRLNFWKDAKHLIPDGVCCAHEVLRVSPKRHWLPADVPLPQGQDAMNLDTASLDCEIFHYGFLRRREAFFAKERTLQNTLCGSFDPKIEAAEKAEGNWMMMDGIVEWRDKLVDFTGEHPPLIRQWLLERGYEI